MKETHCSLVQVYMHIYVLTYAFALELVTKGTTFFCVLDIEHVFLSELIMTLFVDEESSEV